MPKSVMLKKLKNQVDCVEKTMEKKKKPKGWAKKLGE